MPGPMMLDLIRDTELLTDAQVASFAVALQKQFDAIGYYWDITVSVQFIPPSTNARPGSLKLWLKDHSPVESALGFHDVEGQPIGYAFIADDIADNTSWSCTVSHEAWEMCVDPNIDRTVKWTDAAGVEWEAPVEVCDGPEDDQFAVEYEGLNGNKWKVTAIALPKWFGLEPKTPEEPYTAPAIPTITAPFMLAEGGYIGRREIAPHVTDWQQVYAMGERTKRQAKKWYSRTLRRFNALAAPVAQG